MIQYFQLLIAPSLSASLFFLLIIVVFSLLLYSHKSSIQDFIKNVKIKSSDLFSLLSHSPINITFPYFNNIRSQIMFLGKNKFI
jgi:hypothetical protein